MSTKYTRQLRRVRKTIERKGMLCTWYKPGEADQTDPTPEFPELGDAKKYENVPIVLYPTSRRDEGTTVYDPKLQTGTQNLYGIIPGDCGFVPEENDAVTINGSLTHVNYINTTQPDGTPIVHEIGFK